MTDQNQAAAAPATSEEATTTKAKPKSPKVPYAGKEATTKANGKPAGRLPVPPPKGAAEQEASRGLTSPAPKKADPAATAAIAAHDAAALVADPKKEGIPVALQVQNRKPLTPAQQERLDAMTKKLAAKAADDKAKKVGATPSTTRAKKVKAKTARVAKPAKPRKPGSELKKGSKAALIADMLRRPKGCTTAEVLKITGWPAVSMPQQARVAGIKLKQEKDGKVTRYRAA